MKTASKIISGILVSAMLALNVAAAEPVIYQGEIKNYYGAVSTDLSLEAYDAIKKAAEEQRDSVSLAAYNISTDEIGELYRAVMRDNPSLFYLSTSFSYIPSGGIVSSLQLRYSLPKDQIASAKADFNRMIAAIIKSVPAGTDDLGKVLYIHDYMASHFEYDLTYSVYDPYTMLKTGHGVCQAYTGLFTSLMDKLGIEASFAVTDEGNHTWNVVKLDGKWYHIDVTHDDPINDRYGMARHEYFLVSDAVRLAKYPDMECAFPCTDTYYENADWLDTNAPFANVNGNWYVLYDDGLYQVDIRSGIRTQAVKESYSWPVWDKGGYYYIGAFSGLANANDVLYYNSSTEIRSYNPVTGEKGVVYTLADTSKGYIYGLTFDGDRTLTYNIATKPGEVAELRTLTLALKVTPGDLNSDGRVNISDIAISKRAMAGFISLNETQRAAADVNGDGKFNISDIAIIKRAVAGFISLSAY